MSDNSQHKGCLISIVTPAFNEAETLNELYKELNKNTESLDYQFEFVIVENGSSDHSLEILRELHKKDPRVKYISLSRNFGTQGGILSGLSHAKGQGVITMDADLQHPPEYIPKLIAEWEKGPMVVNTDKTNKNRSFIRAGLDHLFYRVMSYFIGFKMGQADFRLLDRKVVDALLALPEAEKFLRGLIAWLGFPTNTIPYHVDKRRFGVSKYRLKDLIAFTFNAVTSFTTLPLRMLTQLGLILLIPSLLYLLFTLVIGLMILVGYTPDIVLPPGWLTLSFTLILFGSIQLLASGVLGEYIGRIYKEIKSRPSFIVREKAE